MAITNSAQLQRTNSESLSIADASQSGIDNLSASFTVECWLKSDTDLAASGSAIYSVTARTYPFIIRYVQNATASEATIQCFAQNGSNYLINTSTTYIPTTSGWNHIAFTANSSTGDLKYFFNGTLRESNLGTGYNGNTPNADTFEIGANNTANYWDGNVSSFRIWSEDRSSVIADYYDINFAANPRSRFGTLEAEWKLDGDATDSTSNGNDLTENGTITYEADVPTLTDESVAADNNSILLASNF